MEAHSGAAAHSPAAPGRVQVYEDKEENTRAERMEAGTAGMADKAPHKEASRAEHGAALSYLAPPQTVREEPQRRTPALHKGRRLPVTKCPLLPWNRLPGRHYPESGPLRE